MNREYNTILVHLLANLGDVVFATSTLYLIRQRYPKAKIVFLVRTGIAEVFKNHSCIDEVIPFSYTSGGDYLSVFKAANLIKKYNFDMSISLGGRFRIDLSVWLAGIPVRVGADRIWNNRKRCPSYLYTHTIKMGDLKNKPIYQSFQKLFNTFINDTKSKNDIRPFVGKAPEENLRKAHELLAGLARPGAMSLAVCVKAEHLTKNWQPERFAEVLDIILEKYAINAFIVGVQSDRAYAEDIIKNCKYKVENLCGKTSLLDLVALFEQSDMLLSIDNGSAHLAAATGLPVVCICIGTSPLTIPPTAEAFLCVGRDRLAEYTDLASDKQVDITVDEVLRDIEDIIAFSKNKHHKTHTGKGE